MSKVSPLDETALLTTSALRVLERITDPFYALDAQWRIVYANPPALAAFGRRFDEVEGLVLWDAYPTTRVPVFHDHLQQVARERRGVTFEAQSPTPRALVRGALPSVPRRRRGLPERRRRAENGRAGAQAAFAGAASRRSAGCRCSSRASTITSSPTTTSGATPSSTKARAYPRQVEGGVARALDLGALSRSGGQPVLARPAPSRGRDAPDHRGVLLRAVGPVVREPHLPEQRWRDRFLQRHHGPQARGACAGRARTRACSRRTSARTSSSRRSRTSCAIRWRRSGTAVHRALARRRRLAGALERASRSSARSSTCRGCSTICSTCRASRAARSTCAWSRSNSARCSTTGIETAHPLIDARRHAFSVHVTCGALRLEADPNRLAQVVGTCCRMPRSTPTTAGTSNCTRGVARGRLVLRVKDNGIGIAEGDLERCSTCSRRSRRRSTAAKAGSASGSRWPRASSSCTAARSRRAATVSVMAASSSCACRVAPAAERAGEGRERRRRGRARGLKVLVADDNGDAAETLTLLLGLDGHEVRTANDGISALDLARDFQPDVVLLDIGMPGLNGFEVAGAIRARAVGTGDAHHRDHRLGQGPGQGARQGGGLRRAPDQAGRPRRAEAADRAPLVR